MKALWKSCQDEWNSWRSTDCNSWPRSRTNEVLRGPKDSQQINLMNLRSWRRRQNEAVLSRAEFRPLNPFAFAFEGLIICHVAALAFRHDKLLRRICWARTVSHCGWKAADKNGQKKMKTWRRPDWIESDFSSHQTIFFKILIKRLDPLSVLPWKLIRKRWNFDCRIFQDEEAPRDSLQGVIKEITRTDLLQYSLTSTQRAPFSLESRNAQFPCRLLFLSCANDEENFSKHSASERFE